MTIEKVLKLADELAPNALTNELKLQYINEVEGIIQSEVMRLSPEDILVYTEADMERELLVKPPYDRVYIAYLTAMYDFAAREYKKYAVTVELFNTYMAEYTAWYAECFHPADGGAVKFGYYLSAYAIAVAHGFAGTEAEWLKSLKGDKGDPFRYEDFTDEQLAKLKGAPGSPGISVAVASVTESEESGDTNTVTFTNGTQLRVKNGNDGAPGKNGKDYVLTDADKSEIAQKSTVSGYITIPASAWKNDTDIYIAKKPMRIQCYDGVSTKTGKFLCQVTLNGETAPSVTKEWTTFTGNFTISKSVKALCFRVYGGPSATYIQPYDIADIKVYRKDDTAKTNLVSEDIAKLHWWMYDSEDDTDRLAISYEDGLKYLHVFRQSSNTNSAAWASAENETADTFPADDYVLECRMRTTCNQLYCTLPFEGIRDASATLIVPTESSAEACAEHGVRGFAQRIGEISFTADTRPTEDITVSVNASYGNGGVMTTIDQVGDMPSHTAALIVTATDEDDNGVYGPWASHTGQQILEHIEHGGYAIFKNNDGDLYFFSDNSDTLDADTCVRFSNVRIADNNTVLTQEVTIGLVDTKLIYSTRESVTANNMLTVTMNSGVNESGITTRILSHTPSQILSFVRNGGYVVFKNESSEYFPLSKIYYNYGYLTAEFVSANFINLEEIKFRGYVISTESDGQIEVATVDRGYNLSSSGYVKKDTKALVNYYLKSEVYPIENTYSKDEINQKFDGIATTEDISRLSKQIDDEAINRENAITDLKAQSEQRSPAFANNIEECTDTTKVYVLPDGYIYAYGTAETTGGTQEVTEQITGTFLDNTRISTSSGTTSQENGIVTTPVIDVSGYGDTFKIHLYGGSQSSMKWIALADGNPAAQTGVTFHFYKDGTQVINGGGYTGYTKVDTLSFMVEYTALNDVTFTFYKSQATTDYNQLRFCGVGTSANAKAEVIYEKPTDGGIEKKWVNTGHAFVPADYEERIVELESDVFKSQKQGIALAGRISSLEASADRSVPYYVLSEAEEVVDKVLAARNADSFVMALASDFHTNGEDASSISILHAGQGIDAINSMTQLDLTVLLGDYEIYYLSYGDSDTDGEDARKSFKYVKKAFSSVAKGVPLIQLQGNHDRIPTNIEAEARQQYYAYIGANNIGTVIDYDNKFRNYGYRDFENYKIRVIYLNTADVAGIEATENVSTEQLNWLNTVALNLADRDWGIIVLTHHPLNWYGMDGLRNALDEYKGKNTGAELIAHFHGHLHNFRVETLGTNNIPTITIPNVCYDRNNEYGMSYPNDPTIARDYGDADENGNQRVFNKTANSAEDTAFNVVVVDRQSRKIHCFNYGSGIDREISY